MYDKIVVGTDGSESAARAVAHAADLAEATGAALHLVMAVSVMPAAVAPELMHTMPASWMESNLNGARAVLDREAASIADRGIEVTTEVATGDPADQLMRAADDQRADVLVVGNRGMQGARRFLLGSVANRCAHHANCAVLIVDTD